jgi:hypothetical protein
VKDKETHQESTITYKAFRDTSYRFDLIGQVDDQGNLMQSDPNLLAQHQRKVPASAPAVVDAGNKTTGQQAIDDIREAVISAVNAKIPEFSTPILSGQPFHVEQSVIEEPFPDCLPALPTEPTPVPEQPIKERKKPGPKPKNKEA